MPHTYASVDDFRAYLVDGAAMSASDARLRGILEGASRTVDIYCGRSRFGSGFGPRVATNRYTGPGGDRLWLDDDFTAVDTVTVSLVPDDTPTAYVEETDYYLAPFDRPYHRMLVTVPTGGMSLGQCLRGVTVAGMAGYSDERRTLAATTAEALDASRGTLAVTSVAEVSAGQTLWLDDEMLYVREVAEAGATVTLATSANADDIVDTATTHGFAAGDVVEFPTLTGGAGLSAGTPYFVVAANLGSTTFQVSATRDGSAVNFTTDVTAGTVRAVACVTVDRAANGSAAATHLADAALALVTHPSAVVEGTLAIAARRWRRRDVNLPAAFGDGGQAPVIDPSERTILRGHVYDLRCIRTAHGLAEVTEVLG